MNIFKKVLIVVLLFTGLTSCESYFDVNYDPNKPGANNLPLSAKLPAALVATVNQEALQLNQVGAFWGGYWGTNNDGVNLFFDLKNYNAAIRNQRDGIPVWETGYNNILYFQLIREEAQASGASFYLGASKIMQGWLFLRMVDVYNNVPFDEAVQGTNFTNPRYEPGKVVYEKAINLITEGIADLKGATVTPADASGDVMFGANINLWVKFANTAKLRALLRQSEANNQAYIIAELGKITQEGSGFMDAGDNAFVNPGYLSTAGKMNPFWETYYRDVQGGATANYLNIRPTVYLLEQYKQRNDPRLAALYLPVNGEYKGVLFGNPDASNPEYSRANTSPFKGRVENNNQPTGLFKALNQPSVLLSSFESLFLQAEAVQRGWISGDAKTLYEKGIQESFNYLNVDAGQFAAYNAQPNVNFDNATDKIESIITQKWLSLNSINSIEAWNDYRRLGMPNFPGTAATGVVGRPLRFMYPETERATNNENASQQGGDLILENRVWWDQR
ncbi:SusD/RagB family nutrient-binding outer membrane lipoprotein [Pontibacter sp. 13R65]|uniref:SusD/RagB family nutrient-binding outer membrane lipoprotein n=1 Tax=Pontibacter sp. 13R65 TaxID=3127458 RepID=UPI00301BF29D